MMRIRVFGVCAGPYLACISFRLVNPFSTFLIIILLLKTSSIWTFDDNYCKCDGDDDDCGNDTTQSNLNPKYALAYGATSV